MKEDFLHFVWKEQLFDAAVLKTEDGQLVQIIDKGQYNHNAGPDFFNCQIQFDNIIWAGNIEIHIKSSDWYKHNHQDDHSYDNVILHVVLVHDMNVHRKDRSIIPTITLQNRFYQESLSRYQRFFQSNSMVYPCRPYLEKMEETIIRKMLSSCLTDRLESKNKIILEQLTQTKNNWDESFYHLLAKSFGFKVNAVPLQLLAESIPLTIIERESNELFKIESLLFGVGGLLQTTTDDPYVIKLKKEFEHQQNKYKLQSLHPAIWKFGKLRPPNFPTIRIAQFAMLLYRQKRIFKRCLNASTLESLQLIFSIEASEFWTTHFHFEKSSNANSKLLGIESINNIIINVVIPFCYAYGKHIGSKTLLDKSIEWLNQIKPEKNKYTEIWEQSNYKFSNAGETQGLIELNNMYCVKNKCIHCTIGSSVMKMQ
jgi:hypothetical protein